MLLFSIIYYASASSPARAAPVTLPLNFTTYDSASFFTRNTDSFELLPRQRIEIFWSCIATILAASWVSVHPNLPHPQDSRLRKTLRRVELMLWAIITPELIIYWAMRQWHGARRMEKEFLVHSAYINERWESMNELDPGMARVDHQRDDAGQIISSPNFPEEFKDDPKIRHEYYPEETHLRDESRFKWTKTHGFFLQMGGFVLQEGEQSRVLGWETLIQHYKAGQIDLSSITEARINDHSKADGFSKGVALLQTIWFIIQCIGRFSDKNLVLTELELVTAALASLSLIMYSLWWNKPFNAQIPIIVTLSRSKSQSSTTKYPQVLRQNMKQRSRCMVVFMHIGWRIVQIMGNDGSMDFINTIDNQRSPMMKVPTFYSLSAKSVLDLYRMAWASFFIAALFGSIHCVGWSSKIVFSSHATERLWKISSTVITGSPFVWAVFFAFSYANDKCVSGNFSKAVYNNLGLVSLLFSTVTIPMYIIARIILLTIAFSELQHISEGALATIQWAKFIPFIH